MRTSAHFPSIVIPPFSPYHLDCLYMIIEISHSLCLLCISLLWYLFELPTVTWVCFDLPISHAWIWIPTWLVPWKWNKDWAERLLGFSLKTLKQARLQVILGIILDIPRHLSVYQMTNLSDSSFQTDSTPMMAWSFSSPMSSMLGLFP